jgi:hypothetical protein
VKVKRVNDNVAMSYVHLHCNISGDVKVYNSILSTKIIIFFSLINIQLLLVKYIFCYTLQFLNEKQLFKIV